MTDPSREFRVPSEVRLSRTAHARWANCSGRIGNAIVPLFPPHASQAAISEPDVWTFHVVFESHRAEFRIDPSSGSFARSRNPRCAGFVPTNR